MENSSWQEGGRAAPWTWVTTGVGSSKMSTLGMMERVTSLLPDCFFLAKGVSLYLMSLMNYLLAFSFLLLSQYNSILSIGRIRLTWAVLLRLVSAARRRTLQRWPIWDWSSRTSPRRCWPWRRWCGRGRPCVEWSAVQILSQTRIVQWSR